MNPYPYPRLRYPAWTGGLRLRENLRITFFMRHSHEDVARKVMQSLQAYVDEAGTSALGWYADDNGDWWELNALGWEGVRRRLFDPDWPGSRTIDLWERVDGSPAYRFEYYGGRMGPAQSLETSALSFWLPTEYLEERGPEHLHELAMRLATPLPFCSGYAGLALHHVGSNPELARLRSRYPGLDDIDLPFVAPCIGTRVTGPSWMNFLGNPALGELGGMTGLRSRLSSPDITLRALPGERAVITLGSSPEAGDTERGQQLPLHRELARLLEPWLYHHPSLKDPEAARATRRWERRFLD